MLEKLCNCTFQGAVENHIILDYHTSRFLHWAARPGDIVKGVLLHRSNTTLQKDGSCKIPAPSIFLKWKHTFWKQLCRLCSHVCKNLFFLLKLHLFPSVHLWLLTVPLCLTQFISLNIKQFLADTVSDCKGWHVPPDCIELKHLAFLACAKLCSSKMVLPRRPSHYTGYTGRWWSIPHQL